MYVALNLSLPVRKTFDKEGYLLQNCDKLVPADPKAFTAFAYGAGGSAGIAYPGNDYRLLVMGFPFETITSAPRPITSHEGDSHLPDKVRWK